jgi:DNA repair exonuclease SbcCD nuclease subunit
MPKIIWRTDVHFGDYTPRRRTGSWTDDVLRKLAWVGDKAREVGADAVLDGGDFFDVKSPTKNSHSLVRQACEVHKAHYACPVYALVGNHDVKYGNISYLPHQPLGVLFSSGIFQQFGDTSEVVLENDGVRVRIIGVPYHGAEYDFERLSSLRKREGDDYLFVACHLLARQGDTGTMFEGEDIIGYNFLEGITDVDVWFFGHWHKDQGVKKLDNGGLVVNVGSLTRGALHLDDLDRNPCVVEVSATKEGISYVRHDVPVRPSQEVFKIDEAVREKEAQGRMDEIVEKMKKVASESRNGATLLDRVREMQVPQEVKEQVISYLEENL